MGVNPTTRLRSAKRNGVLKMNLLVVFEKIEWRQTWKLGQDLKVKLGKMRSM